MAVFPFPGFHLSSPLRIRHQGPTSLKPPSSPVPFLLLAENRHSFSFSVIPSPSTKLLAMKAGVPSTGMLVSQPCTGRTLGLCCQTSRTASATSSPTKADRKPGAAAQLGGCQLWTAANCLNSDRCSVLLPFLFPFENFPAGRSGEARMLLGK